MAGIFEYLNWRGDISFTAVPLCDADRLILAELAYIDLGATDPKPLDELCQMALKRQTVISDSGSSHSLLHHKKDEKLMLELIKSPRFCEIKIGYCESRYSKRREEQFAAMTAFLPGGEALVIFRGTDWTLVGWKEDFNLTYSDELPAQRSAVEYLTKIAEIHDGDIYVTGHSKGGNLAVYASAFAPESVSERIINVTSLDGPGFDERVMNSPEYARIKDRVHTYMPSASIVGAILSRTGRFSVIESRSRGFAQHIPYNWEIMGGGFVTDAQRDGTTQIAEVALNEWISGLEPDERKKFIDTVWSVFANAGVEELGDLFDGKSSRAIIKNYNSMDEESRTYISETLAKLRECAKVSFRELLIEAKSDKTKSLISSNQISESKNGGQKC